MKMLVHLLSVSLALAAATDIEAAANLRGSRQFQPDDLLGFVHWNFLCTLWRNTKLKPKTVL
jgi:hypothetical protein